MFLPPCLVKKPSLERTNALEGSLSVWFVANGPVTTVEGGLSVTVVLWRGFNPLTVVVWLETISELTEDVLSLGPAVLGWYRNVMKN